MKKYNHIFFDLDGTLWDLYKNTEEALHLLFVEFELDSTLFEAFYQRYHYHNEKVWALYRVGKIEKEVLRTVRFSRAFDDVGIAYNAEMIEAFASRFLEICPKLPHLIDGTHELLKAASGKAQLHIITNGFKEVQHIKLDYSNLRPFFKHIIISEDHGFNKPDIKIFDLAQSLSNAQVHECVMIGDNYDADILGALNANWKAIYLSENIKENTDENFFQIKRLIELKDFFK